MKKNVLHLPSLLNIQRLKMQIKIQKNITLLFICPSKASLYPKPSGK